MPRFLRRIFPDNPFRARDHTPNDLQRTRRVLVRSANGSEAHRMSFLDVTLHTDDAALRDCAGSIDRPILAPSLAEDDIQVEKVVRARRRLSKKQRRPVGECD
jgi:hypothetical protein